MPLVQRQVDQCHPAGFNAFDKVVVIQLCTFTSDVVSILVGKKHDLLVVVDEADNLLNTQNSWFSRGETQDKGWLNQLLEEPGARMIWITNSIDEIEGSVLRRFAFSIHFREFNRRQLASSILEQARVAWLCR